MDNTSNIHPKALEWAQDFNEKILKGQLSNGGKTIQELAKYFEAYAVERVRMIGRHLETIKIYAR